MLEHRDDPFQVQTTASAIVDVIENVGVPTSLLRCDLSTIGALAFGASIGAVGAQSDLRHFSPPSSGKGGGGGANWLRGLSSAYVPRTMSYRRLEIIKDAVFNDPDNEDRYRCGCRHCRDRLLTWVKSDEEAYRHSFARLAEVARSVLRADFTLTQSQIAWLEKCESAQTVNLEIEADLAGEADWPVPEFFAGWRVLDRQRVRP